MTFRELAAAIDKMDEHEKDHKAEAYFPVGAAYMLTIAGVKEMSDHGAVVAIEGVEVP